MNGPQQGDAGRGSRGRRGAGGLVASLVLGALAVLAPARPSGAAVSEPLSVLGDAPTYLSVNDLSIREGDAGTTPATFTVTRSGRTTGTSSVQYATYSTTATAGSDYISLPPTTVSFVAGETTKAVTVNLIGDTVAESNEMLYLNLSAPSEATISDNSGAGTIISDDAPTYVSVNDVAVTEGNSGTTPATFTITRSGSTTGPSSVQYSTSSSSATGGSDFTAVAATTLSFAAGETTKTVRVDVVGDGWSEADETFSLNLSSPTGTAVVDSSGVATIVTDDGATYVSVDDVPVREGNVGTTPATFTVTRSGNTTGASTLRYNTSNGSAAAGSDYTAVASTPLSFAPGETTKTVTVNVAGDTRAEGVEGFYLNLTSPAGATISDSRGAATIVNDDGRTYLSVTDVTVREGTTGTTPATFTVTRSGNTANTLLVGYSTPPSSATAGSDYTAVSSALSFAVGETTKTVTVNVAGDTVAEPNETFDLALSPTTEATVSDARGTATIVNDEGTITAGPSTFLSINDVAVPEGNGATTPASFTVTRSGGTAGASSVQYSTAASSGTPGFADSTDYTALAPTTLSFAPGETSKTVTVNLLGDAVPEPDELFSLNLSAPTGATISDASGAGSIGNDDAASYLSVGDVTVTEGSAGVTAAAFTVTRSGSTAAAASVRYATSNQSATAGTDYTAVAATTLGFAAGETTKTVRVDVTGDTAVEPAETFHLDLSSPTGATVTDMRATATIADDEAPTYVSVGDVSVTEGHSGTTPAAFTVTRSGNTAGAVTVRVATADSSARAGTDYTALAATTLGFAAGETTKTVPVSVTGDTRPEANHGFYLNLSSPTGATISDTMGAATIVDDDLPTYLSVNDVSVTETNAGTTPATFTVTRSGNTANAVSVKYTVAGSSATAGSDFTPVYTPSLGFAAGETTKTVTVNVTGDTVAEPNETFTITLSSPTLATISDQSGTATIVNDD